MHDEEVDELLDRLIEILEALWQEKDRRERFVEQETDLLGNLLVRIVKSNATVDHKQLRRESSSRDTSWGGS